MAEETRWSRWVLGARVRTLPAAVVPVALGAAVGVGAGGARWWTVPFAAVVAVSLQIAVNYANDYSDGVRGTDDVRVGPVRLVAGGLASASSVKRAAFAAFGVAAVAGLVLALTTAWWLVAVGLACVAAAWGYTGGSHPYGYVGLGEAFVFVFFGLVATVGTTFVVLERVPVIAWWLGTGAGALACSLMVVNNLRDTPTDRVAGKKTLAVRLGDQRTRWCYVALLIVAFGVVVGIGWTRPWVLLGLVSIPVAVRPSRAVLRGATGSELIGVLGATGRVQIAYGVCVTLGLVLSA